MSDPATQVWIEADDLAAVFLGGPVILLDATLPDCLPLYGLGARVLRLHAIPDGLLLRPMGSSAAPPTQRRPPRLLHQVPGDVLAVITREQPTARRLIAWWQAIGGEDAVPPVVVAESGLAALPVLLRHALNEVSSLSARCADLELALAALREAGEDTRTALQEVSRTLGHRPPAPLLLALGRPVAAGEPIALPREATLRLDLPLPVQGIAAMALHVAAPWLTSGPAALRVRLVAAESGRVAGAWTVPRSAVAPGWLRLDMPAPVGVAAGAEDAWLELTAEMDGDAASAGTPMLSRAEAPADQPALMVWTSQPGGRLSVARHFDWTAWEGESPPQGTPLLPAADLFATARLAGPVQLVPRGGPDASRATLRLAAGWTEATVLLPGLGLEPGEAVRLELRARGGDLRGVTAALALLPPDDGASLGILLASALARTGWRVLAAAEGTSMLALAAPTKLPEPISPTILALQLRNELPDADRDAEIELTGVRLLRPAPGDRLAPAAADAAPSPVVAPPLTLAEHPLALPHGADAAPEAMVAPAPRRTPLADQAPASASPASAERGRASYDSAQLDDHMAGEGYELIDLQLRNLTTGEFNWPRLKFKLSLSGETVTLEFRRGPDFPEMFEAWPGQTEDDYGPVHHIVAAAGQLFGHDRFRTPRDQALLSGLLEILPAAVAGAIAGARRSGVDRGAWADAARAFVQRMRAGAR